MRFQFDHNANPRRRSTVVGKLVYSLLLAVLLIGGSVPALASHGGPVFFVDDDNPESDDWDGDYHFHSICAIFASNQVLDLMQLPEIGDNDQVVVAPGLYSANCSDKDGDDLQLRKVVIENKGVIMKSEEGRDLTKFEGMFEIRQPNVQIIGFDVDAGGATHAFLVGGAGGSDNVVLQGNKAHNAELDGIQILGSSDNVELIDNEVFNNKGNGINVVGNSDGVAIANNEVRSNLANGIRVIGASDRVRISDSNIEQNGTNGILALIVDELVVSANNINNNSLNGITLSTVNRAIIEQNSIGFNQGLAGIQLFGGSNNNDIRQNVIRSTGSTPLHSYGIAIDNSNRNRVSNNKISGHKNTLGPLVAPNIFSHGQIASAGIRLLGASAANTLGVNQISNNWYGILFACDSEKEIFASPSSNAVLTNEIVGSSQHGIYILGTQGRNVFSSNHVVENNQVGIFSEQLVPFGSYNIPISGNSDVTSTTEDHGATYTVPKYDFNCHTGNDEFKNNAVTRNGWEGIRFSASPDNTVLSNEIRENGKDGVLMHPIRSSVPKLFHQSIADFLLVEEGNVFITSNDINELFSNGNDVISNLITKNQRNGVNVISSRNVDLSKNTITHNRVNGAKVDYDSVGVDLRANVIQENIDIGVWMADSALIDLEHNQISHNDQGGIFAIQNDRAHNDELFLAFPVIQRNRIKKEVPYVALTQQVSIVRGIDIEFNNIYENVEFGLRANGVPKNPITLRADRNWWGAARGPAGSFTGTGNAVLGVSVAPAIGANQIFPWLTAPYEYLQVGATSGAFLNNIQAGQEPRFYTMDKTDLDLSLAAVNGNSTGVVITSKFNFDWLMHPEVPDSTGPNVSPIPAELKVTELPGAFKAVSVLVGALNSGTSLLEVRYNDSELPAGVNKESLRLHYWNGTEWKQLNGRSRSNMNVVVGEVEVANLSHGTIIAVAPGGDFGSN